MAQIAYRSTTAAALDSAPPAFEAAIVALSPMADRFSPICSSSCCPKPGRVHTLHDSDPQDGRTVGSSEPSNCSARALAEHGKRLPQANAMACGTQALYCSASASKRDGILGVKLDA